ncbi:MAG: hypothetical protein R2710_00050 [Acidimicrobiales bacterium]
MSGSIPAGLGSLASLVVLDLQNNAFSGSIPTTFGALTQTDLRLQNNVLTGAIPVELGDMASVEWMMLHDNGLSGSIPVELGDATTLQGLSLHGNLLSGAVPVQLSNLASLASLTLQGNAGLGSVPGAVVDLPASSSPDRLGRGRRPYRVVPKGIWGRVRPGFRGEPTSRFGERQGFSHRVCLRLSRSTGNRTRSMVCTTLLSTIQARYLLTLFRYGASIWM